MGEPDGRRVAVEKALRLLKGRFHVEPRGWAAEALLDLYMGSSRPPIRPYHVEGAAMDVYYYIAKNRLEVYAERKYDGTHMQVSRWGIFKHSGDVASCDQLAYLLLYFTDRGDVFERIHEAVEEGYVLEFELYGSLYTPMGFHRSHPRPVDIAVFEVGLNGRWIPPPEKYEVLMDIPRAEHYRVEYGDLEDLIRRLNELALAPETFEGVVAKSRFIEDPELPREYVETSTLVLFKVKKETAKIIRREKAAEEKGIPAEETRIDVETLAMLKSEVRNELAKMKMELGEEYLKDRRNNPEIISRIEGYLREGHPRLYDRVISSISPRDLRKIIAGELPR